MKFLRKFNEHTSYEAELNVGGIEISLPNVSYCEDVKDVHYNTPYNLVRFYVGEITPQQTVKIYTDSSTFEEVQVSESNKWYTYALPKGKRLYKIEGGSVKNVVVKADITTIAETIIPLSTVEASFKGSDTSNVTSMTNMFEDCVGLTSLDVSSFNTSNVTNMDYMFFRCTSLTSLDVSSFNTSKVSGMTSMFGGCNSLTSLTLSSFDTSNVTSMDNMFGDCGGLTSLDLSKWDTSKVIDMDSMFDGCGSLETIRMVGCSQATIQKITNVKPSSAKIITK